jgi:hypothetical protein
MPELACYPKSEEDVHDCAKGPCPDNSGRTASQERSVERDADRRRDGHYGKGECDCREAVSGSQLVFSATGKDTDLPNSLRNSDLYPYRSSHERSPDILTRTNERRKEKKNK